MTGKRPWLRVTCRLRTGKRPRFGFPSSSGDPFLLRSDRYDDGLSRWVGLSPRAWGDEISLWGDLASRAWEVGFFSCFVLGTSKVKTTSSSPFRGVIERGLSRLWSCCFSALCLATLMACIGTFEFPSGQKQISGVPDANREEVCCSVKQQKGKRDSRWVIVSSAARRPMAF